MRKKRSGTIGPDEETTNLIFGSADEMDSILGYEPELEHDDKRTVTVHPANSTTDTVPDPAAANAGLARTIRGPDIGPRIAAGAGSTSPRRGSAGWARRLWIGGWLLIAGCLAYTGLSLANHRPVAVPAISSTEAIETKHIEDLRVGDRVLADNPEVSGAQRQQRDPDPANWLHLTLRMAEADAGTLDIELLRPRQWVKARRADIGQSISMDLPEMGAVGRARVLAIGPCPSIEKGAGRVVTGTFAHSASNVVDVRLVGLGEPIGCTANHRFWSENRQAFISVAELSVGERLRSADGATVRVAEIQPRGTAERVFNLEVDAEHAYYVSSLGVLVHNDCVQGVPSEVEGTLSRVESGVKFPHRNDGAIFQNREGLLPAKPAGYYTEYVHPTPGVSGPGAQRIVIGKGGETYFTPDHYKTFIPVKPGS